MSTLLRAIEIATEAHRGQFDKSGKDYKKLIGEPLYSIYAAQQDNPNAYKPWSIEDNNELQRMWADGRSIADIADHFGRKQSSIIVRMKKLGL